jgi:hypothetical protein
MNTNELRVEFAAHGHTFTEVDGAYWVSMTGSNQYARRFTTLEAAQAFLRQVAGKPRAGGEQ